LVENLDNGRSVKVRINDRGPFAANRIIDVSKAAADKRYARGRHRQCAP
jgi:rare lipoprotein A